LGEVRSERSEFYFRGEGAGEGDTESRRSRLAATTRTGLSSMEAGTATRNGSQSLYPSSTHPFSTHPSSQIEHPLAPSPPSLHIQTSQLQPQSEAQSSASPFPPHGANSDNTNIVLSPSTSFPTSSTTGSSFSRPFKVGEISSNPPMSVGGERSALGSGWGRQTDAGRFMLAEEEGSEGGETRLPPDYQQVCLFPLASLPHVCWRSWLTG
jgi:hypothetical protein